MPDAGHFLKFSQKRLIFADRLCFVRKIGIEIHYLNMRGKANYLATDFLFKSRYSSHGDYHYSQSECDANYGNSHYGAGELFAAFPVFYKPSGNEKFCIHFQECALANVTIQNGNE